MWTYVCLNDLYHHGIPGMRWGVRRFQNEDGTLTPAGKARVDKLTSKAAAARKEATGWRKAAKTASTKRFLGNKSASELASDAAKSASRKASKLEKKIKQLTNAKSAQRDKPSTQRSKTPTQRSKTSVKKPSKTSERKVKAAIKKPVKSISKKQVTTGKTRAHKVLSTAGAMYTAAYVSRGGKYPVATILGTNAAINSLFR